MRHGWQQNLWLEREAPTGDREEKRSTGWDPSGRRREGHILEQCGEGRNRALFLSCPYSLQKYQSWEVVLPAWLARAQKTYNWNNPAGCLRLLPIWFCILLYFVSTQFVIVSNFYFISYVFSVYEYQSSVLFSVYQIRIQRNVRRLKLENDELCMAIP